MHIVVSLTIIFMNVCLCIRIFIEFIYVHKYHISNIQVHVNEEIKQLEIIQMNVHMITMSYDREWNIFFTDSDDARDGRRPRCVEPDAAPRSCRIRVFTVRQDTDAGPYVLVRKKGKNEKDN